MMKKLFLETPKTRSCQRAGFTLIEIMVAISIFVLVAMIVTGALIMLSGANRKLQNIKTAVDNMNFTLNNMAVRIREGRQGDLDTIFDCKQSFNFIDFDGNDITYVYDPSNNKVNENSVPLTSDQIKITDLEFCQVPTSIDFKKAITIYLVGVVNPGTKDQVIFKLQTSVAQRNR